MNKIQKQEKYQNIYQAMEPLRVAKKNTIHSLASVGRKNKWLRYPILCLLVAFVFLYNLFLYMFIRMKVQEKFARAMSLVMTVVIVVTSCEIAAFAVDNNEQNGYYRLSAISDLEQKVIEVTQGTAIEDIEFPDSISATLDLYVLDKKADDVKGTEDEKIEEEVPEDEVLEEESEETEEPEVTEPEVTEPEVTEPEVTEPEVTEPEVTEPEVTEPEVTEPGEMPEDEIIEEETEELEEPEVTEPEVTEPEVTEPEVTEPEEVPETEVKEEITVIEEEVVTTQSFVLEPANSALEAEENTEILVLDETKHENETEEASGELVLEEKYVETITANLPVSWVCEDYDGEILGEYIFRAVLESNKYNDYTYFIEENVELPTITVRVVEVKEFVKSVVVDGINIQMQAAPGVFPEDALLLVEKVTDASKIQKIEQTVSDEISKASTEDEQFSAGKIITFDIKVVNEAGEEYQPKIPEGKKSEDVIKVTFTNVVSELLSEYGSEGPDTDYSMEVFHIDDNLEQVAFMETKVEGDDLSISPEHFSLYGCTCQMSSVKSVYSWNDLHKAVYVKKTPNVRLRSNITIKEKFLSFYSTYLLITEDVDIDLNGYTLSSAEDQKCAIYVLSGTLTIHDKSSGGNGKITASKCDHVIYCSGGDFNLTGGSIYKAGNTSDGVYVNSYYSEFEMTGGRIYGGFDDAIEIGSGVSNKNYPLVKISGGYIDGANYGIYSPSGSNTKIVEISGGEFKNIRYYGVYNGSLDLRVTGGKFGGSSSNRTYGIYVSSSGKLSLDGTVTFSNNKAGDIYVGSNSNNLISVGSSLAVPSGSKGIGIVTGKTPTVDGPVQFTSAATLNEGKLPLFYSAANSSHGIYWIQTGKYLATGPAFNCDVVVKPYIEGYDTPGYTKASGSTPAKNTVGKVAIGSDEATFDMNGQSLTVKYNTPLTLKATLMDPEHYVFKGWRLQGESEFIKDPITRADVGYNYALTVQGDGVYEAVFARKTFKIDVSSSNSVMGGASIVKYVADGQERSIPADYMFEQGSLVTIQAVENKVTNSTEYYNFKQWSDGVKGDAVQNALVPTYQRTVEVTGKMSYKAQFINPPPSADAEGELFVGVQLLTENPYSNGKMATQNETKKILLVQGTMSTINSDAGSFMAVAGLPPNHARMTLMDPTNSNNTLGGYKSYYLEAEQTYTNVTNADGSTTKAWHIKDSESHSPLQNEVSRSAGSDVFGLSVAESAKFYYAKIDTKPNSSDLYKGAEFDTCPGGIIYKSSCGFWHYWCNAGGVQGAGPYNAYTYTESTKFKAYDANGNSNISVKVNDIRLSDSGKVTGTDITVTIKADVEENGVTTVKTYTLANLNFAENGDMINFNEGDRTIELNLGGVLYIHTLPEAILSRPGTDSEGNPIAEKTEYSSIKEALETAQEGDTVYVYGPALSENAEGIEVAEGVKIITYDGTEIDLTSEVVSVGTQTNGTVNLLEGTMTVTPSIAENGTNNNAIIGVGKGTVITNEVIKVSTENGGQVTTTEPTQQVAISPDGNPNHQVVYTGCEENKTYGMNNGILTTEEQVEISRGTEYELTIPGIGSDGFGSATTIKTDAANTGKTTIKQDEGADGEKQIVVESEKANDTVTVGNKTVTTSQPNTQIIVNENEDELILGAGSVELPQGSSIMLPNGNVVANPKKEAGTAGGNNPSIGVSADGSVTVPNGGKVEIESGNGETVEVAVPKETPPNLPSKVVVDDKGNTTVQTPAGNNVEIGGEKYQVGDYETEFNVNEEGKVTVTDGNVVLAPGQSIVDANGTEYINTGTAPLDITMSKEGPTQIEIPEGGSFEYKPEGAKEALEYENPGGNDATFSVDEGGNISLESELEMPAGKASNVSVSLNGNTVNIQTPSTNTGDVLLNPVEGTITVEKMGDKVVVGDTEYESTAANTVLKPVGNGKVELESGGVKLDMGEEINVSNSAIQNTKNNPCDVSVGSKQVEVGTDDNGDPIYTTVPVTNVHVPNGGGFALSDDISGETIYFENTSGQDKNYTIDENGALNVGANQEISFSQNGKTTTIETGNGGASIVPTQSGVQVTIPAGETIVINGKEYKNSSDADGKDLVLIIDKNGVPILASGKIDLSEGALIQLPGGDKIISGEGTITVDSYGGISVPDNGSVTIKPTGKLQGTYTASNGPMELNYDPEIGIPTLTQGEASISKGSSLNMVTNKITTTEEGSDDTYDREQMTTYTNTGDEYVVVDRASGEVSVPNGGGVYITSEIVDETTGEMLGKTTNTIKVPVDGDEIILVPQEDGTTQIQAPLAGSIVEIDGMQYTTNQPDTLIEAGKQGTSLLQGGVTLDGGNTQEKIIVNDTEIKNAGGVGSSVDVVMGANKTTELTVSPNGLFGMSVPGKEESEVVFKNPSQDNEAEYVLDADGNIKIENESTIEFETSKNVKVEVSASDGNDATQNADLDLKITKDGVELSASDGNDIVINDVVYENAGEAQDDFIIVVDPEGDAILKEGTTTISDGNNITLPADTNGNKGSTIMSTDGEVTVADDGTVMVPENQTTVSITSPDGTKNTFVTEEDNVKINCPAGENVPTLENGTVKLAGGSSIESNDIVYKNADNSVMPSINDDGSATIPKGGKMEITSNITGGSGAAKENKIKVEIPITNEADRVLASPKPNGSMDFTVAGAGEQDGNNKIIIDNGNGSIEYETVAEEGEDTRINVSDIGNTLLNGGVILDGGKNPKESIIVNKTVISNSGDASSKVSVTKQDNGNTEFVVSPNGKFDMSVPGAQNSAVTFTNLSESQNDSTYVMDESGNISLGEDSKIGFQNGSGSMVIEGGEGVSFRITKDGVEVAVEPGETVVIDGVEYSAEDNSSALKIVVDNQGNKIITRGAAKIPEGETVCLKNESGELIEIKQENDNDSIDKSFIVGANGGIEATPGSTVTVGDATYVCDESENEFDLAVYSETKEVVVENGDKVKITNGNAIFNDGNMGITVSTTGDKGVSVDNSLRDGKPKVTVPAGGNVTIGNKETGAEVEIILPEDISDEEREITIDDEGNISVALNAGEKITIGGITYTADESGTLTVNGTTGKVKDPQNTIVNMEETVIDPERFNKENYQYEIPAGESVTINGIVYEAPTGGSGVTISGNPNGNPVITLKNKSDSIVVGGTEYKAEKDNTKFVVNEDKNITLVDNGNSTNNSSLSISGIGTMIVDGNKITASETGTNNKSYTISKTKDGNKINVMTGADVAVELPAGNNLQVVGNDTLQVNGVEYQAPQNGMTLSGNAGSSPTIEINKAGDTVKVGNESYKAGTDNTQIIVNSPNNVTLVDNGKDKNSALQVGVPSKMTIDGNTITAEGDSDGGYTISKIENGNVVSVKEGTKLSVVMGKDGSDLTINESVQFNGADTGSDSITITSSSEGTTFVVDKTVENEAGEYVANIVPSKDTIMKPVVDENGNIIGFETSLPTPKPPVDNPADDEEDLDVPTTPSTPGSSYNPEDETEDSLTEDSEEDPENETEAEEGEDAEEDLDEGDEESDENTEDDENVAEDDEEYPEDREPQNVEIETLEEAKDVQITGNTQVKYGAGEIRIIAEGKGDITSDLETVLKACLNDKELEQVNQGESVEVRFTVKIIQNELSEEEKQQLDVAYRQYAETIPGLQIAGSYGIVLERRIGNEEWKPIHELNEEMDIVVDIPKELRKENRTYYLIRNHQGTYTVLSDIDEYANTITVSTSMFSTYTIGYSDADVSGVDIDKVNQQVNDENDTTCKGLWIWLIIVLAGIGCGVWYYKKRKKQTGK